jgi:predicted nucleic acid-binding Zn ribbon protein
VRLVFGQDEQVAAWVCENLGVTISPPFTAIGATRDGFTYCIGAVFNRWNGSDLEITLYGPGGLTRGNLRGIYHYVFVQCGANRLSAVTPRSNANMRKLLPRLGFEFEGTSKRYFGTSRKDDGMRYVLFPENALKWM